MFEWQNIQSFVSIRFSKYNYNNKKYRNKQQNSMVLAQKQKYIPMEQDIKPRNKPMHLWVPYFLTKEARIYSGAKRASSINGAGKTGQLHVKEWN